MRGRLKTTLPVALALTLAAGCGSGEDRSRDPGPDAPPAATTFYPVDPGPQHRMAVPDWDIGTGFVRVAPASDGPPGSAPADTMLIRAEARNDAPLVARAYHADYQLRIETAEAGLRDGALEVGYEERALPVVAGAADYGWVEVSYAFGEGGSPRTGWIDLEGSPLDLAWWDRWLEEWGVLFFLDPDSVAFFDVPGGEPVAVPLASGAGGGGHDYILYPLRTDGAWMEVRVVSPSDYCWDPPASEEWRVWIRYLGETGRPRVWYSTRGC